MTTTQEILFGVASQTLVLVVDRPITSVTSVAVYEIDDDDTSTAEVATTGSASIDSATEATTAAAGYGQTDRRKMSVASTTGFVAGRRYRISKAGLSEDFDLDRVDTDTALYARHPLVNAYATAATIDATLRASISVLDSWAADITNVSPAFNPNPRYRVKWTVVHTDTGATEVHERNFDLVRQGAVPTVSPLDVDAAQPGWIDALPPDYKASRGRPLIAEALRALRLDLYKHKVTARALRNAEVFAELVIARTIVATAEVNVLAGRADVASLEMATKRYDARIAGLVGTPVLAVDTSGAGGATTKTGRSASLSQR